MDCALYTAQAPPWCAPLSSAQDLRPLSVVMQAKGQQEGAWLLPHPLQELQAVCAAARAQLRTSSPAQFQGEAVVVVLPGRASAGDLQRGGHCFTLSCCCTCWLLWSELGAGVQACSGCCGDGKGSQLRCVEQYA